MSSRLLVILFFLLLTFSASGAWATEPGPYLELEGYGTWVEKSDNQASDGTIFNATYNGGVGGGLVAGYDFVDAYPRLGRGRLEVELANRRGTVDKLKYVEGSFPVSGNLTMTSIMFTTIADYHRYSPLVPYMSIGVGYAEVSIDQINSSGTPIIASGSDGVFACQLGAGLGIELNERLVVDLGYRFFATQNPEFKLADGSRFISEIASHNVMVGLRLKF